MTIGPAGDIVETPCRPRTGFAYRAADGDDAPAAVPGDGKDWTWVLERAVPRVRVRPGALDVADRAGAGAGQRGRRGRACWPGPTPASGRGPTCGRRSSTAATSATCSALFDTRLGLMLDEDDPQFANWDQDETAVAERYGEQDPAVVAAELAAAGDDVAASFAAVDGDQWDRRGRRSDGACSRSSRSPATSSTTRCTTCGTSAASTGAPTGLTRTEPGAPPVLPARRRVSRVRWCRPHRRPCSLGESDAARRPVGASIRETPCVPRSRRVTACRTRSGHDTGAPCRAVQRRSCPTSGRWRRSAARAS